MASQTGSIDLTASNSVKLAAEAGWQSDLDSYYTKSEIDVTVNGINSTVSTKVGEDEVISSINQSSESVSINANKINLTGAVTISDLASDASVALTNAAKTATDYVTDINNNGITVHPKRSDYATNGGRAVINADGLTVYLGSDDVASYGSSARIGKSNSDRVTVDSTNGITIYKGNRKRLQTTANGIDVYGSDGTTSIASFGSTVTLASDDDNHLVLDGDGLEFLDQDDNRLFYILPYDGDGIPEDSSVTLSTDSGWFVVSAGGYANLQMASDYVLINVKEGNARTGALFASGSEVVVYQPLYAYDGATASYQVVAEGTQNSIALRSNTAGNRGLYDVTNNEWILYREFYTEELVINVPLRRLPRTTDTCTLRTANATVYNNFNHCWSNGACCTIQLCVNLKSSLANADMVDVADAPSGYRPPYAVFGSVMVTGQNINLQAEVLADGTIRVNNRSGSAVTTSANIYMSFTFAP